jgi:hypothetical protein
MTVWINAYEAPNTDDVVFSKGYPTAFEALAARGRKSRAMMNRYIGDPIPIELPWVSHRPEYVWESPTLDHALEQIKKAGEIKDRIVELLKTDPLI